jgi:hypothetical protein
MHMHMHMLLHVYQPCPALHMAVSPCIAAAAQNMLAGTPGFDPAVETHQRMALTPFLAATAVCLVLTGRAQEPDGDC